MAFVLVAVIPAQVGIQVKTMSQGMFHANYGKLHYEQGVAQETPSSARRVAGAFTRLRTSPCSKASRISTTPSATAAWA